MDLINWEIVREPYNWAAIALILLLIGLMLWALMG